MQVLILTGGKLNIGHATKIALVRPQVIIAVDNGASHCKKLKLTPDFLVGDLDSISTTLLKDLKQKKVKILKYPKEKNFTDTELALDLAQRNKASSVTILGGVAGPRIDHLLGNILLLSKNKYSNMQIKLVDGNQEIYLARNSIEITGTINDTISLLPIDGFVRKMKSSGLKYDLSEYSLSIQGNHGISNVFTKKKALLKFPGKNLLIFHTFNS